MNRIAELRKKHNLSQTELANTLNIAQNTLSQYENELRTPSSRIVLALSDLFGVTPNYLLGEPEPEAPKDYALQSVTRILQETDITRINLYLRKGWRLLHVGEDSVRYSDGTGYSHIMHTLGWFGDPLTAQEFPQNRSNESEVEDAYYKKCTLRDTGEEVFIKYNDPNDEPPDIID